VTAEILEPEPVRTALPSAGPLVYAKDLERQMELKQKRHDREMADLREQYEMILDTATEMGRTVEVHPWATYRLTTEERAGRRSIDEAAVKKLFPELCETVVKAPTLAKAEKELSKAHLALVVKPGKPTTIRTIEIEAAPIADLREEAEP